MKGFLSTSFRLLVNVESLNGIESIGNLSRHRTVPIVVREQNGYEIRYVPAISGESVAHAFQALLVESAKNKGLPVGHFSSRGELLKFTADEIMKQEGVTPPVDSQDARRAEIEIMLKDVVCDVGGFLYAGNVPIKRTSRFQVGYMIPALDDIKASALEAQFHVRHAPSLIKTPASEKKAEETKEPRGPTPYNVEVASAVYTLSFNIDIDGISRPSTQYGKRIDAEKKLDEEREERIKATLMAFTNLLLNMSYGAKRSRFLPTITPLAGVAAVSSSGMFSVSPGNSRKFIEDSVTRKNNYLEALKHLAKPPVIDLIAFSKEDGSEHIVGVEKTGSLEEMIKKLIRRILDSGA